MIDQQEELTRQDGEQEIVEEENERMTLMVFSGDLDKALGAFVIATGAALMDIEVTMFFAFWGLNVLRKKTAKARGKSLVHRMMGWMLPKGPDELKLSNMNMMGLGTRMMKSIMKAQKVMDLPALIKLAQSLDIKFVACEMSMNVMGLKKEELVDGVQLAGVATAVARASESKTTLFIS